MIAKNKNTRRAFLLGAAAIGLAGIGTGAVAMPNKMLVKRVLADQVDPWEGRDLRNWERDMLDGFANQLNIALSDTPVAAKLLDNHVRVRIPAKIAFKVGKDELSADGVAILTVVAEELTKQPDVRVEIVGHHDARADGYAAFNFTQRRAMAAKATLMSRGIAEERLKATGLGLSFPFTDPYSEDNQRLELLVRPT